MTPEQIYHTTRRIKYKDWRFEVNDTEAGFNFIRVAFVASDVFTGLPERMYGRWWYIDDDANEDAVIMTCYAAIKMAEEHEIMENFQVDGIAILCPHISTSAHKGAYQETFNPPDPVPEGAPA